MNDEICIDCIARRIDGRWKGGRLLGHPCHFSFRAWVTWYLVESNCASWFYLYCASLLSLLSLATRVRYSEWERIFSSSKVKDDILHWGQNFQKESIFGAVEDNIPLDTWTWQIHEGTSEIMTHGSEVDRHHVGYLLKISDTQAPVGQLGKCW
jgi:hypothetical protein